MNKEAIKRYQEKGRLSKKSPKKTRRTRNGFEPVTNEERESDKKTMTYSEKFPSKKISRVFMIEQEDIKLKEPEFLNVLTQVEDSENADPNFDPLLCVPQGDTESFVSLKTSENEPHANNPNSPLQFHPPVDFSFQVTCSCGQSRDAFACKNASSWLKTVIPDFNFYDWERKYRSLVDGAELAINPVDLKQIQKDVVRTFQKIDAFKQPEMQAKLVRILKTQAAHGLSLTSTDGIGYVQGMNFIGGSFLYHCEESVAFWLFNSLLEKRGVASVFDETFSGMQEQCTIATGLIENFLPDISEQFMEHGLHVSIFMQEWIMTLLCSYVPIHFVSQFLNEFFKHGWIRFHALSLSILDFLQEDIINADDMEKVHLAVKIMKDHTDEIEKAKDSEFVFVQETESSDKRTSAEELELSKMTKRDLDWIQIFSLMKSKYSMKTLEKPFKKLQ